jgi:hypothetical protein
MGTKTDQVERSIREIVETEQGPNGQLPSERDLTRQKIRPVASCGILTGSQG